MSKQEPNSTQLAALFERIDSDVACMAFTFGTRVPPDQLIRRLRRRATILGRHLIRFLPESRKNIEPNEIFGVYTYELFIDKLRQVFGDCQELLYDGNSMEPAARAKFYGRRLGNRGRKLLMLSRLELIDRDVYDRIMDRENEYLLKCARASAALGQIEAPATTEVVAIDDPQTQLAARDRRRSGFILNVGSDRIVFDCVAKIEKRVPLSSFGQGEVLPMKTKSVSEQG